MEVILTQDIKNLGLKDDLVKVKNGYGRNYLIPQGFAIPGTESNKKMLNETIKQRAFKEEKIKKEATAIADTLKNIVLSIPTKVNAESGKIYGSVNTLQIAEALKKKGFNIERKNISIEEDSIKSTGTYEAQLNLHREVKTKVQFEVVAE
jgi:large subunit ribosomal protein L9